WRSGLVRRTLMEIVSRRGEATRTTGALAVAVGRGVRVPEGPATRIDRAARGALGALLRSKDFVGESGEVAVLYPRGLRAPPLRRTEILADDPDAARAVAAATARGAAWGEAVCLARDLARTPGEDLPPERLAERAREIASPAGARVQVLGVPEMERLGMGAVL